MSPSMETAQRAAARAQDLIGGAFAELYRRLEDGGKLRGIDEHQLALYELAWCASELAAARALIRIAEGASQLQDDLAAAFTADTLQRLRLRLGSHPRDFGLSQEALDAALGGEPLAFGDEHLSAASLAAIGQRLREHGLPSAYSGLTDEHRMMRDTFRRFAEEVVAPQAERIHRHDEGIPDDILQPLAEMGLFGLSIPMRYGGLCNDEGEDTLGMIVATEELSRGSLGAAGSLITRPEITARALLAGGTEAQQERWLPQLAAGDPLCAVAVTEPDYGSDVASMRLRATRTDEGWVLDGAKSWCTYGGKAGVLLVLARTDPDLSLGHRGLSLFLVSKPSFEGHEFELAQDGAGRLTGRATPTIGYRGMHSFDLWFDRYFVPDDALIGEEAGLGKGFYFQMAGFAGGRIQTAARALGVMQAAFDEALRYTGERHVFGKPIGEYQLSAVKLARMGMQLAASRALTYTVGEQMNRGEGQMEASLAKLFASRVAEEVCREAMQLHGGMGYAEETAVSRYYVDARVLSIFEGAEEILALKVIARGLLQRAGQQRERGVA